MTKKRFDEFVAKQSSETKESGIDWSKKRDEWLEYLAMFYKKVESFLQEYISKGQIRIDYGTKRISEEYIGEYEVRTAIIHLGRNQIRLDPISTNLIGAKGRVDMIGPNGKVKFVLVDRDASAPRISVQVWIQGQEPPPKAEKPKKIEWAWKIGTPPPRIKYIELHPESFFDAFIRWRYRTHPRRCKTRFYLKVVCNSYGTAGTPLIFQSASTLEDTDQNYQDSWREKKNRTNERSAWNYSHSTCASFSAFLNSGSPVMRGAFSLKEV